MDAFQAERDQGVTLDAAQTWLCCDGREYVIIGAPPPIEYLKNMVRGAAASDAAVLVIDAAEGLGEQSRRHGYLLRLLGVDQITVAINKMDLVDYDQARFEADAIRREYVSGKKWPGWCSISVAARISG